MGPCVTGKTTLANYLANQLKIAKCSLDDIFIDFKKTGNGKVVYFNDKICQGRLKKVIEKNSWIVEGEFHLEKLAKMADFVVYVNKGVWQRLYYAVRRYIMVAEVRNKFGFGSTLVFLKFILRQAFSRQNTTVYFGKEFLSVRGFKKFIEKMPKHKVLKLQGFEYGQLLTIMLK